MEFTIPESFASFSINGIRGLIEQAQAEYTALKATVDVNTVSDEDLERLKALRQFALVDAPAEIANRERRSTEFAALDEEPEAAEEAPEDEAEATEDPEPVTASAKKIVDQIDTTSPRLRDIAKEAPAADVAKYERPRYSTLIASAGVPSHEAGSELANLDEFAKAFESRAASFASMSRGNSALGPQHYPVAVLRRDYPDEFSVQGDETDYAKLQHVMDETRLPGGSLIESQLLRQKELQDSGQPGRALVAAAGWCAPSETDYDICLQITTDGLLDVPEVQARRGGIRHNTGIEFDSIFGSGTGFFNLTEAQVAAGTSKTCLEIPCPSFVDTRLGVTGLCLTGNILANRGYPEFTAAFTRGALAASAHQINREQISAMIADSTAVNLTAAAPWATDGSTVSQVLSAVELAIVDIKYRLRLQRSATLEVILPYWILAQMRADWIRRNGGNYAEMICLADEAIRSGFACRGARPQFVYDWQDAFSNVPGSGAGADTPINNFNTSLQFLVYPAGTWVRAVNDVITLNAVYDSTKLATNQLTHLFTETGWAMVRMCPVSRVYTVPVCPSGKTTDQGTLTCP